MGKNLLELIQETENFMDHSKGKYFKELKKFSNEDEELVAEFLRQERADKKYFPTYKDYIILVAKPEKYTKPKEFIEYCQDQLEGSASIVRRARSGGLLKKISPNNDALMGLLNMEPLFQKYINFEAKIYERYLSYAKEISAEKHIPISVLVKTQSNRDEIYKRIFPNKTEFDKYYYIVSELNQAIFDNGFKALEWFEGVRKKIEAIPLVGSTIKKKLEKELGKTPDKQTARAFMDEEINYHKNLGDRIYK